jgi:hypothetical protein
VHTTTFETALTVADFEDARLITKQAADYGGINVPKLGNF